MIVVKTDRVVCIYVRTNRRVKWQYATYCGRYRTNAEALRAARAYMGNFPYEYLIENRETDERTTGFINWPGK